jgi:hypothetical protein
VTAFVIGVNRGNLSYRTDVHLEKLNKPSAILRRRAKIGMLPKNNTTPSEEFFCF